MPLFLKRLCPQTVVIVSLLAVFLSFTSASAPAFAAKKKSSGNPRYASLVMDADTGQILSQRYADKKLHPASLTKVMTLLMVFDALDQNRLDLHQKIKISKHAANMVPSKIGLPAGSSIRVEDAIYALVTKSANDIAAALAEHLGGTESNFAKMMTRRAQQIGMTNSNFKNASGLHDPAQVSSARDMAKLAYYVIKQYPQYYTYFSTRNFSYNGKNYHNHNRMLGKYKGMDGMKTGFTQPSGFNLVASAVRDNRRLIGVVFGGRSAQSRNDHMQELLDRGFEQIQGQPLLVASAKSAPQVRQASGAAGFAETPLPGRKPVMMAALNAVVPAAGTIPEAPLGNIARWSVLNPAGEAFSELMGQGDYDPANSKRIETGLLAIAAHKGEAMPKFLAAGKASPAQQTIYKAAQRSVPGAAPPAAAANSWNTRSLSAIPAAAHQNINDSWGIQIGAFSSRAASDQALHLVKEKLPSNFEKAQAIIAPLKTPQGYVFRARLSGLTAEDAQKACGSLLKDCLILAPNAY